MADGDQQAPPNPTEAEQQAQTQAQRKKGMVAVGAIALIGVGALVYARFQGNGTKQFTPPGVAVGAPSLGRSFPDREAPAPAPQAHPIPTSDGAGIPQMLPREVRPAPVEDDDTGIIQGSGDWGKRSPRMAAAAQPGDAGYAADSPLAAALRPSNLGRPTPAWLDKNPLFTLSAYRKIPCLLDDAINSTLPGLVSCHLQEPIWNDDLNVILMAAGTHIGGEIQHGLVNGQHRLFILWREARTPDHVKVPLMSPAADELGRAGVTGEIDNHFMERFGAAMLFSVIGAMPQLAQAAMQHGNGNSYIQFSPEQQVVTAIMQNTINIPPELWKNPGEPVVIYTTHDVPFPPYAVRMVDSH